MDKSVAIEYRRDAPRIIAKAEGILVKKMLQIAEEKNISIYRDVDLTGLLFKLDTGASIPEELFGAVASVMAYCYKVNSDFRKKINSAGMLDG
ncbi:MAG TPA: EscU/YscU/HrcU family type III secretion system export apparatus switch protein [Spirochaetota bacterium]|nr:EscU/YscU/HrcU family type III secretion system export apparatus switch protein [Spirochaetota bacterium]HPJ35459.1 EscU/YscU/HrcU family type III secretion system export apparatus switch protein [Spirochaetota bacterium]